MDGQRTKANLFLVDGISVTSSAAGAGRQLQHSPRSRRGILRPGGILLRRFGDVAGGVINLQSKSGTNNWHGSLFEFFRNDAMDAADFFSNATGQPRIPLRYNQFGGSWAVRYGADKTFSSPITRARSPHSSSPEVTSRPAEQQRQGDFSGLWAPMGRWFRFTIRSEFVDTHAFSETLFRQA